MKPNFAAPHMIGFKKKKKTQNNPTVKTRVVPALLQTKIVKI